MTSGERDIPTNSLFGFDAQEILRSLKDGYAQDDAPPGSRVATFASRMPDAMAVQVTIYLNEADQWHHRPLHMEILNYLRKENVYAATALHCVAGFLGRHRVETAHLVEAGGKLPVIVTFVDLEEHVQRVLPKLFALVPHRLIVREKVQIEQGSLD